MPSTEAGRALHVIVCRACVALHCHLANELLLQEMQGSGRLNVLSPRGGAGRTRP